ncbi:MAG: amidohydrolase [Alphaproteobacteria bacterium]
MGKQGDNGVRAMRKPRYRAPPGACDTHVHVFNRSAEELPASVMANMPYGIPRAAGLVDLAAMHGQIGIERVVIVQTGANGTLDQFADFVAAVGPHARGVARIDDSVTDAQLDLLERAGVRGCRFNFVKFLRMRPPLDIVERVARRLAERGWHMCAHLEPEDLLEVADFLETLPIALVIDHLAHPRCEQGTKHPAFRRIVAWLEQGRVWAKIGNLDRWSKVGPPDYADAVPFIRETVHANPEQVIWCTDWPNLLYKNPYSPDGTLPDCGPLIDLLARAIDDERLLQAILVDNPKRLYGF